MKKLSLKRSRNIIFNFDLLSCLPKSFENILKCRQKEYFKTECYERNKSRNVFLIHSMCSCTACTLNAGTFEIFRKSYYTSI